MAVVYNVEITDAIGEIQTGYLRLPGTAPYTVEPTHFKGENGGWSGRPVGFPIDWLTTRTDETGRTEFEIDFRRMSQASFGVWLLRLTDSVGQTFDVELKIRPDTSRIKFNLDEPEIAEIRKSLNFIADQREHLEQYADRPFEISLDNGDQPWILADQTKLYDQYWNLGAVVSVRPSSTEPVLRNNGSPIEKRYPVFDRANVYQKSTASGGFSSPKWIENPAARTLIVNTEEVGGRVKAGTFDGHGIDLSAYEYYSPIVVDSGQSIGYSVVPPSTITGRIENGIDPTGKYVNLKLYRDGSYQDPTGYPIYTAVNSDGTFALNVSERVTGDIRLTLTSPTEGQIGRDWTYRMNGRQVSKYEIEILEEAHEGWVPIEIDDDIWPLREHDSHDVTGRVLDGIREIELDRDPAVTLSVRLTADAGSSFDAPVASDGTFTIPAPNVTFGPDPRLELLRTTAEGTSQVGDDWRNETRLSAAFSKPFETFSLGTTHVWTDGSWEWNDSEPRRGYRFRLWDRSTNSVVGREWTEYDVLPNLSIRSRNEGAGAETVTNHPNLVPTNGLVPLEGLGRGKKIVELVRDGSVVASDGNRGYSARSTTDSALSTTYDLALETIVWTGIVTEGFDEFTELTTGREAERMATGSALALMSRQLSESHTPPRLTEDVPSITGPFISETKHFWGYDGMNGTNTPLKETAMAAVALGRVENAINDGIINAPDWLRQELQVRVDAAIEWIISKKSGTVYDETVDPETVAWIYHLMSEQDRGEEAEFARTILNNHLWNPDFEKFRANIDTGGSTTEGFDVEQVGIALPALLRICGDGTRMKRFYDRHVWKLRRDPGFADVATSTDWPDLPADERGNVDYDLSPAATNLVVGALHAIYRARIEDSPLAYNLAARRSLSIRDTDGTYGDGLLRPVLWLALGTVLSDYLWPDVERIDQGGVAEPTYALGWNYDNQNIGRLVKLPFDETVPHETVLENIGQPKGNHPGLLYDFDNGYIFWNVDPNDSWEDYDIVRADIDLATGQVTNPTTVLAAPYVDTALTRGDRYTIDTVRNQIIVVEERSDVFWLVFYDYDGNFVREWQTRWPLESAFTVAEDGFLYFFERTYDTSLDPLPGSPDYETGRYTATLARIDLDQSALSDGSVETVHWWDIAPSYTTYNQDGSEREYVIGVPSQIWIDTDRQIAVLWGGGNDVHLAHFDGTFEGNIYDDGWYDWNSSMTYEPTTGMIYRNVESSPDNGATWPMLLDTLNLDTRTYTVERDVSDVWAYYMRSLIAPLRPVGCPEPVYQEPDFGPPIYVNYDYDGTDNYLRIDTNEANSGFILFTDIKMLGPTGANLSISGSGSDRTWAGNKNGSQIWIYDPPYMEPNYNRSIYEANLYYMRFDNRGVGSIGPGYATRGISGGATTLQSVHYYEFDCSMHPQYAPRHIAVYYYPSSTNYGGQDPENRTLILEAHDLTLDYWAQNGNVLRIPVRTEATQ